jgi:hypothetical protein
MFTRYTGLCPAVHLTTTFREASFHRFQEPVDISTTFYADCKCTGSQLATSGSHSTLTWHSVSQKCIHSSAAAAYGNVKKIHHFLYTDDLKLIGRSEEELKNEIRIEKTSSKDIKMEFSLE